MQQAPFLGYYEEGEALSHDYNYTRYNEYNQEISCDTLTIEVIIVITYAPTVHSCVKTSRNII